jgi:hypothetical protein
MQPAPMCLQFLCCLQGLITHSRHGVPDYVERFARPAGLGDIEGEELLQVVKRVKPTILMGLAGETCKGQRTAVLDGLMRSLSVCVASGDDTCYLACEICVWAEWIYLCSCQGRLTCSIHGVRIHSPTWVV